MTYSIQSRKSIIDEIVERLGKGEPLRQICRDEHMPSWHVIYNWANADKDIFSRIRHARDLGYEALAEDCLQIADDAVNDWMSVQEKDGSTAYKINGEHINRSKLRIETRLKLLAKWKPEKYGDKITLAGDKNNPLEVRDATRAILGVLTIEQLEQIEQLKLGADDEQEGAGDKTAITTIEDPSGL